MKADSVTPTNPNTNARKRPLINAKSTGYVAATGMGLSMLSGVTKNKFLRKNHKTFAGISFVSTIAHLYLVLNYKHKKQMPKPHKKP